MRLLLIAAVLPLAACQSEREQRGAAQASGTSTTRSFTAADFTGVDLRGSDDVEVRTGPSFSVMAEGDPKVLDQLDIRVIDGTLRVARKEGMGRWTSSDEGVRVTVTLPRLTSASVSGSGDMTVQQAEGDFSGAIAGSGDLRIASLRAGNASLSIAGSGDLAADGTVSQLAASIAGAGDIDVAGLTAASADISIAGSGSLRGTVNGPATVAILGSGDVTLGGGARCTISALGSGEARCG